MKVVTIYLEDEEHGRLKELKGGRTWKEVLVAGAHHKYKSREHKDQGPQGQTLRANVKHKALSEKVSRDT